MRFVVRKFVKEVNLLFVGGVHAAMIEDREKGQTGAGVSFRQIFGRGLQATGVGFGMVLLVLLLIPTVILVLLTAGVWTFTDKVAVRFARKQTIKPGDLPLSQNIGPDSDFVDHE